MNFNLYYVRFLSRTCVLFGRLVLKLGEKLRSLDGILVSISQKYSTYCKKKLIEEFKKPNL